MPFLTLEHPETDPRLDVYRQLNRTNLTRDSGLFVAESRLLVERLVASGWGIESVLAAETYQDDLARWLPPSVPVYLVPKSTISEIIGFQFHRGMLACGRRPTNPSCDQLLQDVESRPATLVICPHIVDPTNLAGVIRNCTGLGVDGLILGRQSADPFSRRVVRVSMGTVFRLPIRISDDLHDDLERLHSVHRFTRVGTVLDDAAVELRSAPRPPRLALLFGNEGHGLDAETLRHCDQLVTLTMARDTDSLNLATSSGIFLYHYLRLA